MENPEKFDGKSPTGFNQWWESVTMYLGFYPDTTDGQKIAWVGTLLTDTALVWHLHRYRELRENNTWANYSAAVRAEYHNDREAADAQLRLGQLKYQGSIRAYLTEFRALNNFARATGEALREKIDLAMPDAVLDMRFTHYLEDFADDEGFLQATHQAGLQVEKKKALRQAREQMRGAGGQTDDKRKEKKKEEGRPATKIEKREPRKGDSQATKTGWETTGAALRGVPQTEINAHKKVPDGCWRCGRTGHRTFDCFSFQTIQGTELPQAPWKVAGAAEAQGPSTGKRKREEPSDAPAAKQQKVVAVEEIVVDQPLWADTDDSDF